MLFALFSNYLLCQLFCLTRWQVSLASPPSPSPLHPFPIPARARTRYCHLRTDAFRFFRTWRFSQYPQIGLPLQQHELILYLQRFYTHSIRTIQQTGTTPSVSMVGAEPLKFPLHVLWTAVHLRYSSLFLSKCSCSSHCLHAWLRASTSSNFPVPIEKAITQLVCT